MDSLSIIRGELCVFQFSRNCVVASDNATGRGGSSTLRPNCDGRIEAARLTGNYLSDICPLVRPYCSFFFISIIISELRADSIKKFGSKPRRKTTARNRSLNTLRCGFFFSSTMSILLFLTESKRNEKLIMSHVCATS